MEKYIAELTSEERKELSELVSKGKAAAQKITHARILLQSDASADGPSWTDKQISEAFGVHTNTVHGIRRRFVAHGLSAALDRKKQDRPSRRRLVDGDAEAHLIALRCGEQIRVLLEQDYPDAEKVVLVMDNLNTHSMGSLYEAFAPAQARALARRLDIHYTPKHGSWLNVAEIELSVLSRQCLDRRIESTQRLERECGGWNVRRNGLQKGIDWQFTTEDARIKLKRLYPQLKF